MSALDDLFRQARSRKKRTRLIVITLAVLLFAGIFAARPVRPPHTPTLLNVQGQHDPAP